MSAEVVALEPEPAGTVTQAQVTRQFVNLYAGKRAYCHSQRSWFAYDDWLWRRQDAGQVTHLALELALRMSANAKNKPKMQEYSWGCAVEHSAMVQPEIRKTAADWDSNINLAGTPGGTIDTIKGELRDPLASDFITKCVAVIPDEMADCPLWEAFLHEATGGDRALVRYLQQVCGYALTGDISEQALFFIYGPGGRGKGVFLSTIQGIMGDYSVTAPAEALEAHKFAQHTTDLAMMQGARLVAASETDEGATWNEKRIKALTGGDQITARKMHKDNTTFTPQLTLIVVGNHAPSLRSVDDAMRRRFNVIPFRALPKVKDAHLAEKLRAEWPSILRWIIDGCMDWRKHGFIIPDVVAAETAKYFSDQDFTREWVETRCHVEADNTWLCEKSSTLFGDFTRFANENGVEPGNTKTFRPALERMGFASKRSRDGVYFYGIRLRTAADRPNDVGTGDFV